MRTEEDSAAPASARGPVPVRSASDRSALRFRLERLEVDPRLDEHEAPVVALLLLLAKDLLAASLEFLGARLEEVKIGTELEPDDDQKMDDHRQQHTIPPREGAADDELILVPIVEVEMYQ